MLMITRRQGVVLLLAAAATILPASGCTLEDGTGFGRLSARLWSRFEGLDAAAGRLTGDGWYRTSNSFELKLSSLTLKVEELRVRGAGAAASSSAAAGDCSLDPADPPAGCTLCHSGHCHCDGALKSYAELEADLCGASAGAATATLASLPVPATQDLRGDGTRADLSACRPSCELDAGQVDEVQIVLDRLALKARLRDRSAADRLQGAELSLALDLDLAGAVLSQALSDPELIDRDHPYLLDLTLVLPLTAKAFDGVDWHQLQRSGNTIAVDSATNRSAGETITTNLGATTIKLTVTRAED